MIHCVNNHKLSVNNLFSTGIYVYSLPVVVGGFAFCSSNILAVYVETGEESGRNFVAVANFMGRDFKYSFFVFRSRSSFVVVVYNIDVSTTRSAIGTVSSSSIINYTISKVNSFCINGIVIAVVSEVISCPPVASSVNTRCAVVFMYDKVMVE